MLATKKEPPSQSLKIFMKVKTNKELYLFYTNHFSELIGNIAVSSLS